MNKLKVAILAYEIKNETVLGTIVRTVINKAYVDGIVKAGGIPIIIPLQGDVETLLDGMGALLIPGGEDVDPRFYKEEPHQLLGATNYVLDDFFIKIIKLAIDKKIPILGICRGMQIVNVAMGGTLAQDVSLINKEHLLHVQSNGRDGLTHKVKIDKDSKLYDVLGVDEIFTNTLHHQCVKDIGEGLKVTAYTSDGIPEAMENEDGSIMLVQWHPEELIETQPKMINLFKNLVNVNDKKYRTEKIT